MYYSENLGLKGKNHQQNKLQFLCKIFRDSKSVTPSSVLSIILQYLSFKYYTILYIIISSHLLITNYINLKKGELISVHIMLSGIRH